MSPGFYIDTMAVTDIQWISPAEPSFQNVPFQNVQPTNTFSFRSDVYVNSGYSQNKKQETRKERLIRWASAFKVFYPKLDLVLIKSDNDDLARYRETFRRRLKFKGQNRNLIL